MTEFVQKMNYKRKVNIVNESLSDETYIQYKDKIESALDAALNVFIDFDIDLTVKIYKTDDTVREVVGARTTGYARHEKGKFTIGIDQSEIFRIDKDNGLNLYITVYHEMAHVYDIYHTEHNDFYIINVSRKPYRRMEDFVIYEGFQFWTEFYAYAYGFRRFKEYSHNITFLNLVNFYDDLLGKHQIIKQMYVDKDPQLNTALEDFRDSIDSLAYMFAMYIAGEIHGKPYNYKYCKKTRNRVAYKKAAKFYNGVWNKIFDIYECPYRKGMARKLYVLGSFILKQFYLPFGLEPIKNKGKIVLGFYYE